MADKIIGVAHNPGETLYFQVIDGDGDFWNGSAFETFNGSNWGTYDVAMTQYGTSHTYRGTFPATIAAGNYSVIQYRQTGASPAQTDQPNGSVDISWDGSTFVRTNDILGSSFSGPSADDIAAKILVTPANLLATDASGKVTAENEAGIGTAVWATGTRELTGLGAAATTALVSAIWAAGTRTLTGFGSLVTDITTAVWAAGTRTLTAIGFPVTATDMDAVKAVTDKLDSALELDGAVYRYTTNALEQSPGSGDATEAKQDTIIATLGTLDDDVAAKVLATPANLLATDASGKVTAENTTEIATSVWASGTRTLTSITAFVSEIATGVWASGTRTLSSYGSLVTDIATAVWAAGTRTLTAIGFPVTATDMDAVKAVTDKLDTALELDGAVYRYTTNALEQAAASGDATEAKQDTIIASLATIDDAVAAKILATPANLLATDATGKVTVENTVEIGTQVWNTTTRTLTSITALHTALVNAIWAAGTRTLTDYGTLDDDVATAVWNATTRTLSEFGFTVTATDVANIKTETDKLNNMIESDGPDFRFKTNALEQSPSSGDATEAKQDTIIAAIAALNDPDVAAIVSGVLAGVVDGTLTVQGAVTRIVAAVAGKAVRTAQNPQVIEFYKDDGTTVEHTATVQDNGDGRTIA